MPYFGELTQCLLVSVMALLNILHIVCYIIGVSGDNVVLLLGSLLKWPESDISCGDLGTDRGHTDRPVRTASLSSIITSNDDRTCLFAA